MLLCNLAVLLAERRLKISKVSADTGISRTTLTSLVNGSSQGLQFDTLNNLCVYLRVNPSQFFAFVPFDVSISKDSQYEPACRTGRSLVHPDYIYEGFRIKLAFSGKTTSPAVGYIYVEVDHKQFGEEVFVEETGDYIVVDNLTVLELSANLPDPLDNKDSIEEINAENKIVTSHLAQIPVNFKSYVEKLILDCILRDISSPTGKLSDDIKIAFNWGDLLPY